MAALAVVVLLGGGAVGVVGGAAGADPQADTTPAPVEAIAGVGWSSAVGVLDVVTWGSSSCPTIAADDATMVRGELVVTFQPGNALDPCTADWSPTTSSVTVPDGVDDGEPIRVRVGHFGTVEVEPRGPDREPGTAGVPGPVTWLTPAGNG